jgi:hypothetical protein
MCLDANPRYSLDAASTRLDSSMPGLRLSIVVVVFDV